MNKKNRYIEGILSALISGIAWGFSGACGQLLMQSSNVNASWVTLMRMFFSGLILSIASIIGNKKAAFDIFKQKNHLIQLIAFTILGLILSQVTYLKTISYSNAGTATVLQYLGPLFIMLYVCISTRKLPNKLEVLSVILAFSGVIVLATHGNFKTLQLSGKCLFWGLSSAIGLTLYNLLPEKLMKTFGSVEVSGFGMLLGGIIMFFYVHPWNINISLGSNGLPALLGMIVIGTLLAYPLFLHGVNCIGSVKASMIACVEPVSATLFSMFWLKTKFFPIDAAGFVLILSTVFILSFKKNIKH